MSTTVITFITPDSQEAVNSRINPQANAPQMSIDRIAEYLTSMANGSNNKTSLSITIGALPTVNL